MFSRLASRTFRRSGKRFMGGHAHEEVHREGFDKLIRGIFPQDHYFALAVITFYGTIGFVAAKWPSGKKAVKDVPAPVVVETSADDIPSVESPAFEAWANVEGNIEKWLNKLA